MAKYKNGNFFQVSREAFRRQDGDAQINALSLSAFKLYIWLHELEHKFTSEAMGTEGKRTDWFFRSDADLSEDTGLSVRAIQTAKKELKEFGFTQQWKMHWKDTETGKLSKKHVTAYRILK